MQAGSFTPIAGTSDLLYESIDHVQDNNNQDATASGDADRIYLQGVPIVGLTGHGLVAHSSTARGLAQASTITIGTVTIQPLVWSFTKYWRLQKVTSGTESEWLWYRPEFRLAVRGTATGSGGPLSTTQSIAAATGLTFVISNFGTLSIKTAGHMKIDNFKLNPNYKDGGGLECEFEGNYSGGVTYATTGGGSADFGWLFPSPDSPVKGNLTLATGAESITHSALFHGITISNPIAQGGRVPFQCSMMFDKA